MSDIVDKLIEIVRETPLLRSMCCGITEEADDIDTLRREFSKVLRPLEDRLAEEIKWGHARCTPDNCVSSGTDCPAREGTC